MSDADTIPASSPKPWGILATIAWALLAAGVSIALSLPLVLWWLGDDAELAAGIASDGVIFAALTCLTTPAQVAILALAARFAKWRIADYLGLVWPNRRQVVLALWVTVVFAIGYDGLTILLGRDVVTPFQIDTYYTAQQQGGLWLLWVAFVVVAPAGEEILFRGFLFRGWALSARTTWLTIVLIAGAWAATHIQYDWFGIAQIFLIGLIFGWIRCRSGSTTLTIFLHGLLNAWATVQTAMKVEWLS
jgi:membrane protease YdiL (CAAX protease family)